MLAATPVSRPSERPDWRPAPRHAEPVMQAAHPAPDRPPDGPPPDRHASATTEPQQPDGCPAACAAPTSRSPCPQRRTQLRPSPSDREPDRPPQHPTSHASRASGCAGPPAPWTRDPTRTAITSPPPGCGGEQQAHPLTGARYRASSRPTADAPAPRTRCAGAPAAGPSTHPATSASQQSGPTPLALLRTSDKALPQRSHHSPHDAIRRPRASSSLRRMRSTGKSARWTG